MYHPVYGRYSKPLYRNFWRHDVQFIMGLEGASSISWLRAQKLRYVVTIYDNLMMILKFVIRFPYYTVYSCTQIYLILEIWGWGHPWHLGHRPEIKMLHHDLWQYDDQLCDTVSERWEVVMFTIHASDIRPSFRPITKTDWQRWLYT